MDLDQLHKEITYTATTSSGAGGQHVNKVATRVVLSIDVVGSNAFAKAEHANILNALKNRLTKDGRLQLSSQETRSQATNKEKVFEKLIKILKKAATPAKTRKKRIVPAAVKRKRLSDKKKHSEKKANRNYRLS